MRQAVQAEEVRVGDQRRYQGLGEDIERGQGSRIAHHRQFDQILDHAASEQ